MLIEISGMQQAGKSTLIEGLTFNFNLYKFPMGGVCKYFAIKPTWELQVAKDISTLQFYEQVVKMSEADEIPTISDRGPLSTIYYSLLFKRATVDQIEKFVEYLSNFRSSWYPVWVEGINQPSMTRGKNDGFDTLQTGLDDTEAKLVKQTMFGLLDKYGIKYTVIYNNFENPIDKNQQLFDNMLTEIIRNFE